MTLGCGSWGGNVTSDNVSPLHLMDIKRVAFETRPVKSARPALATSTVSTPAPPPPSQAPSRQPVAAAQASKIGREEIAAIVDRFLAGRRADDTPFAGPTTPAPQQVEVEAGSMYAGPRSGGSETRTGNGGSSASTTAAASRGAESSANGHKAIDFVSEDDVRRAIQKGEKIYVNSKTIITPAARDLGEPAEVFARA